MKLEDNLYVSDESSFSDDNEDDVLRNSFDLAEQSDTNVKMLSKLPPGQLFSSDRPSSSASDLFGGLKVDDIRLARM